MISCRIPERKDLTCSAHPRWGSSLQTPRHSLWGGARQGAGRPSHLVRGCLTLLGAHRILLVVGKHDQANEAAHAERHLLAGEDGVAGAAREASAKRAEGVSRPIPTSQKASPRPAQWVWVCLGILPHPSCRCRARPQSLPHPGPPIFPVLPSQHCSLLRAGTEVALHLRLVHSIQGEHHEDTPEGQCPECVPHKWVRIQPAIDTNMSLWPQTQPSLPSSDIGQGREMAVRAKVDSRQGRRLGLPGGKGVVPLCQPIASSQVLETP